MNPGLHRQEGKFPPPHPQLENFRSVSLKREKAKNPPNRKDHTYNLRGNHTHRIAEAVNLAPGAGGRGKGKKYGAIRGEPEKAIPRPRCRSLPKALSLARTPL